MLPGRSVCPIATAQFSKCRAARGRRVSPAVPGASGLSCLSQPRRSRFWTRPCVPTALRRMRTRFARAGRSSLSAMGRHFGPPCFSSSLDLLMPCPARSILCARPRCPKWRLRVFCHCSGPCLAAESRTTEYPVCDACAFFSGSRAMSAQGRPGPHFGMRGIYTLRSRREALRGVERRGRRRHARSCRHAAPSYEKKNLRRRGRY